MGSAFDRAAQRKGGLVDPKDGSESYGVQKAQCEEIVRAAFGKGSIEQRLVKGGLTLAPGKKSDAVQMVDVRDLVAFYLKLPEEKRGGTYNAAGPRERQGDRRRTRVPTVGGDGQGHARVVGHGARGTSRQAPLHHHTGNRSEGAGGLESERLGTGHPRGFACAPPQTKGVP